MTNIETRVNGILNEIRQQRSLLADRAAELAGAVAVLTAENEALKARVAELEPK